MTPNDAVVKFVELRILASGDDYVRSAVLDVLRAVATTATENEARRCAGMLENDADQFKKSKLLEESSLLKSYAEKLLRTGGLKVEE